MPALGPDFADALLRWYRSSRRDLPWRRRQDDAYAVWISEIMLQQTTVAAVVGFFERWMARFPTIGALAEAPLDDVLRLWAGLGYYSRARNLRRAAEIIARDHAGRLPETVDALMALPGIGRYTAGAISSIAYNRDAPVLDANVIRVLGRLAAISGDPKKADTQARLWRIAAEIIPTGDARDFNQALMELGALVCSPRAPRCDACPVAGWCRGHRSGEPERFPAAAAPRVWKQARHVAAAAEWSGRLLIVRRPEGGVWAGLWEMPRVVVADGECDNAAAARALRESVALEASPHEPFATIRHVVMDTKITLVGFSARAARPESARRSGCADLAWIDPDVDLRRYAVSSPQRRLIGLWNAARDRRAEQPSLAL